MIKPNENRFFPSISGWLAMVVFASCSFMTVGNALKKDETQNKQICKRQPCWISTSANQKWFRLPGFFLAGDFPCGVFFPSRKTRFFSRGFSRPKNLLCLPLSLFLCFFLFRFLFYFFFVSSPAKKYAYSALSNDRSIAPRRSLRNS